MQRSPLTTEEKERSVARYSPLPLPASRYHPFYCIYLLEQLFKASPRLGEDERTTSQQGVTGREAVRLRPNPSLALPVSDLEGIYPLPPSANGQPRVQVVVNFAGLYGATSPLPLWYSAALLRQPEGKRGEPGQQEVGKRPPPCPPGCAFLDIFNHRLLSLRYRAWLRNQPQLGRYAQRSGERRPDVEAADREQGIVNLVLHDAAGFWAAPRELSQPETPLLRYAGLFLLRNRPGSGLQSLLASLLAEWLPDEPGCDVTVSQLAFARYSPIPDSERPRIPNMRCGRNAVIGRRQLDRMNQLGIHTGPVSYPALQDFLPGNRCYEKLRKWVRYYLRQPLDVTLEVRVPSFMVPPATISRSHGGLRIGGVMPSRLRRNAQLRLLFVGDFPALALPFSYELLRAASCAEGFASAQAYRPNLVIAGASLPAAELSSLVAALQGAGLRVLVLLESGPASSDTELSQAHTLALAERIEKELWSNCMRYTIRMPLH
jgi:type VI secretion system protein ImpH